MRAALYTFGIFRERAEHPANDGFHERNDPIFDHVRQASGFIGHAGYEDDPDGPPEWGPHVLPRYYIERGDGWSPATLSLWRDLEAIAAFAYQGLHGEAVRMGRQWFVKGDWPPYAIWWVGDAHRPDWAEAVARYHLLADAGCGPDCFDLKNPFDAEGQPSRLDMARLAHHRADNKAPDPPRKSPG